MGGGVGGVGMALVMLLVSFYTRGKQALQGLGGKSSWRAWVLEEMEDLLGEASEPRESSLLQRVWRAAGPGPLSSPAARSYPPSLCPCSGQSLFTESNWCESHRIRTNALGPRNPGQEFRLLGKSKASAQALEAAASRQGSSFLTLDPLPRGLCSVGDKRARGK